MKIGLDSFLEYGKHEHSLLGNLKNVFTAFVITLIWTMVVMVFLNVVAKMDINGVRSLLTAQMDVYAKISPGMMTNAYKAFFFTCIFAPLWEEAVFRFGPFGVARALEFTATQKTSGYLPRTICLFPVLIGSSIVFGLLHGSVINIMIQGVFGMFFAWVMIKSGYWSAVLTHSLWNFMLMFGMPIVLRGIN
ncbi:CPBP family intramembrane metalloprotease [Patescibacteria group bacterium]|nr:CPBP family intramembrane metalloprotease [Patescibacteria group bacterium]